MNWYYADANNQRVGPIPDEAFLQAVDGGTIGPETLVWRSGMAEWLPWAVAEATGLGPRPAGGAGKGALLENRAAAAQRIKEGLNPDALESWEYATVGKRFAAQFIDGLILTAVNWGLGFAIGLALASTNTDPETSVVSLVVLNLVSIALAVGYDTYFQGSPKHQATPGKKLMKIRVITTEGENVSYGRAMGRYFAEILSSLLMGIGYLMAFWDPQKRALHDRLASTLVITVD